MYHIHDCMDLVGVLVRSFNTVLENIMDLHTG